LKISLVISICNRSEALAKVLRSSAVWGGVEPHDKLIVNGTIGKLRGDLRHHNAATLDGQNLKISRYSEDFLREACEGKRPARVLELFFRPLWRFLRGYILRLGLLDGGQGYYIAWMTSFYTVTRYAKVYLAKKGE
jgi:hypothetical protein